MSSSRPASTNAATALLSQKEASRKEDVFTSALLKRGRGVMTNFFLWHERYVCIRGQTLFISKAYGNIGKPTNRFNLEECVAEAMENPLFDQPTSSGEDDKYKFPFKIILNKANNRIPIDLLNLSALNILYFSAPSEDHRSIFIEILNNAANSKFWKDFAVESQRKNYLLHDIKEYKWKLQSMHRFNIGHSLKSSEEMKIRQIEATIIFMMLVVRESTAKRNFKYVNMHYSGRDSMDAGAEVFNAEIARFKIKINEACGHREELEKNTKSKLEHNEAFDTGSYYKVQGDVQKTKCTHCIFMNSFLQFSKRYCNITNPFPLRDDVVAAFIRYYVAIKYVQVCWKARRLSCMAAKMLRNNMASRIQRCYRSYVVIKHGRERLVDFQIRMKAVHRGSFSIIDEAAITGPRTWRDKLLLDPLSNVKKKLTTSFASTIKNVANTFSGSESVEQKSTSQGIDRKELEMIERNTISFLRLFITLLVICCVSILYVPLRFIIGTAIPYGLVGPIAKAFRLENPFVGALELLVIWGTKFFNYLWFLVFIFEICTCLTIFFMFMHRILGWGVTVYLQYLLATDFGSFNMSIESVTIHLGLDKNEIIVSNYLWENHPDFQETPYFCKISQLRIVFNMRKLLEMCGIFDMFGIKRKYKSDKILLIDDVELDSGDIFIERKVGHIDSLNLWSALRWEAAKGQSQEEVRQDVLEKMAIALIHFAQNKELSKFLVEYNPLSLLYKGSKVVGKGIIDVGEKMKIVGGNIADVGKSAVDGMTSASKAVKDSARKLKDRGKSIFDRNEGNNFGRSTDTDSMQRGRADSYLSDSEYSAFSLSSSPPSTMSLDFDSPPTTPTKGSSSGGLTTNCSSSNSVDPVNNANMHDGNKSPDDERHRSLLSVVIEKTVDPAPEGPPPKVHDDDLTWGCPKGWGVPYRLQIRRVTVRDIKLHALDFITTTHIDKDIASYLHCGILEMTKQELKRPLFLDEFVWALIYKLISHLLSTNMGNLSKILALAAVNQGTSKISDLTSEITNSAIDIATGAVTSGVKTAGAVVYTTYGVLDRLVDPFRQLCRSRDRNSNETPLDGNSSSSYRSSSSSKKKKI